MNTIYIPIALTSALFLLAYLLTRQSSGHVVSPGLLLFCGAFVVSVAVWAIYGLAMWLR